MKKIDLKIIFVTGFFALVGFAMGYFLNRDEPSNPEYEESKVYAIYDGGQVQREEVLERIQPQINELRNSIFQLKKRTVEQIIQERLSEKIQKPQITDKTEITEAEFNNFLKQRNLNSKMLKPLDRKNILGNMRLEKAKQEQRKELQAELEKLNIRWKIHRPNEKKVEIGNGSLPRKGAFEAPVKIIVFGNYHCPQCGHAEMRLKRLEEKYKDKLKVFFRFKGQEPPASMAFRSIIASFCAADQGQFWEYHDLLMMAPPLEEKSLVDTAGKLNLDMAQFQECLGKPMHLKEIEADLQDAQKLPPDLAPTFVINGYPISGVESLENISELIERGL